ncbi:MAG: pilin [Candidatus Magasanikbacteria bacterium]
MKKIFFISILLIGFIFNLNKVEAASEWCLTPENNCVLGAGGPCPGQTFATQGACEEVQKNKTTGTTKTTVVNDVKSYTEVKLENPIGTTNITQIFGNLIKVALGIMGSLAMLVLVYGGTLWLTSAGNADKVKQGTSAMLWAVIGIVVIFASYAIISLVLEGIGVGSYTPSVPNVDSLGRDDCQAYNSEYQCQSLSACGLTSYDQCTSTNSCQKNLCPGGTDNVCCKVKDYSVEVGGCYCQSQNGQSLGNNKQLITSITTKEVCISYSDTEISAEYNGCEWRISN